MDLTLWLLNRCVSWEERHPGVMSAALAAAGHDVRLGHRCVRRPAPSEDGDGESEACVVNDRIDSSPGALMHEGAPEDHPSYDEYFVPIPLKCIGNLHEPGVASFWAKAAADAPGAALFEQIVRGRYCADCLVNPCFDPSESARYWSGRSPRTNRSERTPSATWPFADVRMNTCGGRGYYQILREHTRETGRRNVLVGYSQGGTVARFLAFLDREVFFRDPCIHGIVTVQGALQGSPLALEGNAEWIARALTTMLLSFGAEHDAASAVPRSPEGAREAIHAMAARGRRVHATLPGGPSVFAALATLLDAIINANARDKDKRWLVDILRTTRKWISGLSGEKGLAFRDLDPRRLDEPGSVLHAIASTPVLEAWHGAVVGTDGGLEELVRGFAVQKGWTSAVELLFRGWLMRFLRQAEGVYRTQVMDVSGGSSEPLGPRLARFRAQWANGGLVEAHAHDFVIPSASQLMPEGGPRFLGNLVNADASHVSGARLDTDPTDLDLTCQLLGRMTDVGGAKSVA